MSDPFSSARRKIARGKKHLDELKDAVKAFFVPGLYEKFSEPHPNNPGDVIYKVRLSRRLPDDFSEVAGDVLTNLRASLDHAVHAVAVANGCPSPNSAYFPFSKDATHFENNLKGRCADVPRSVWPLLRSFKPYAGGNEVLWTLNCTRGQDNHALLIPGVTVVETAAVEFTSKGVKWTMPAEPVWDSVKNEMELFTITHGGSVGQFKGKFNLAFYVAFGDVEGIRGKNAMPLLDQFVDIADAIVNEIDAEARRLGIVNL